MRGARAITEEEIKNIVNSFTGKNSQRDRALTTFLCLTGYRISEALSIKVGDVYQLGKITDRVTVSRKSMKAKRQGRDCILHPRAKQAIEELLEILKKKSTFGPALYLFQSQKGANQPLSRYGAWEVLKKAFAKCGISGAVSCHSTRKFYAGRIYDLVGHDLIKCQKSLGHFQISSTLSYLSFKESDLDQAVLAI